MEGEGWWTDFNFIIKNSLGIKCLKKMKKGKAIKNFENACILGNLLRVNIIEAYAFYYLGLLGSSIHSVRTHMEQARRLFASFEMPFELSMVEEKLEQKVIELMETIR